MQETFKSVKIGRKFWPYSVSNMGRVRNDRTQKFLKPFKTYNGTFAISLCCDGVRHSEMLHTLVSRHFNKHERNQDSAYHINFVNFDNRSNNLEPCTAGERGARTRAFNYSIKKKVRGVYSFPRNKTLPWRAMIRQEVGKVKTLGYFETKRKAESAFKAAFFERWGIQPY